MRYIIGIDLGTTNSCVAYVDTELANPSIQPFRIPQLSTAGYIDSRSTLPSFCYLAAKNEFPVGSMNLPWGNHADYFVGHFALEQGAKVPTRLVRSAKSWLCHSAANRRDKILPVEAANETDRISPIAATARYLTHIKDAWNFQIAKNDPDALFEEQEVILTVPASFDEVARTLTVEAAKAAGFVKMTLLEEPQAAFYGWISYHENEWQKKLRHGDHILVCDVGGGTTDFSLIEVMDKDGTLTLQRMAVGDHLLLGGDNMDQAIAHHLEKKIAGKELSTTQWLQLCHEARSAKEVLLAPNSETENYKVVIQGAGSGVIQGSIATEISRDEIQKLLLDGFFSQDSWEDALKLKRARGLRSMGLPYEDEPSITKHLAHFLSNSSPKGSPQKFPDYILFNGGTMKALSFQKAVVDSLNRWNPSKSLTVLPSANLDLAVSRGASYYGKVRRGLGVKIGGGAARGYYLAVNTSTGENASIQALTLLPRGSEEGYAYQSEKSFSLIPNTPISFQLYTSHVRLHDKAGDLIAVDLNEMQPMPRIQTVLRYGKQQAAGMSAEKVPVRLNIALTAIGTLELSLQAINTPHQWALEFQLKSSTGQDNSLTMLEKRSSDETLDAAQLEQAQKTIDDLFAKGQKTSIGSIMESLEKVLGNPRAQWSLSTLRKLADTVLQNAVHRKRSLELEARWWNLIGFFLRPGFGYPVDDFRIKELWKIILADIKKPRSTDCQIQSWICYRRVAGGFNRGQQAQIASELIPTVFDKKSEKIRALGAMELLDVAVKTKLGKAILERVKMQESSSAEFWALGRLGARHLMYGSTIYVLPAETCEQWIKELLCVEAKGDAIFSVMEQLARKTEQRTLNISVATVQQVLDKFSEHPQIERLKKLLLEHNALTHAEQEQIFGDQLPIGITLEN